MWVYFWAETRIPAFTSERRRFPDPKCSCWDTSISESNCRGSPQLCAHKAALPSCSDSITESFLKYESVCSCQYLSTSTRAGYPLPLSMEGGHKTGFHHLAGKLLFCSLKCHYWSCCEKLTSAGKKQPNAIPANTAQPWSASPATPSHRTRNRPSCVWGRSCCQISSSRKANWFVLPED